MATDPLQIEAEVRAIQARKLSPATPETPPGESDLGLVASLIKEFGLGLEPRLRRSLYDRLARLELQHGQTVEILIAEARALARAPGVARKGNYFARAICLKLREAGIV